MADKTADAIKFLLRLPKPLHKRLMAQAKRNNVSLNTEIVNALENREAQTVKAITGIIQPLLDQAVTHAAQIAGHIVAEVAFGKGDVAELKQRLARVGILMQEAEKPDEGEK